MRNIIIAECVSTGTNFIEDIINRGHNPIVLHLKPVDTEDGIQGEQYVFKEYETIPYDFDMIYEKDTFEETLEEVRKYDPLLILPGSERGVILASKLSHELGLLCNPIENLDALTFKDKMQEKIAEAGLRSIKGKRVTSLEEALEFYDCEGLKEVVVKPVYSASSVSVRICLDRDELIRSVNEVLHNYNGFGEIIEEIVVQERIDGDEYFINTVSHDGFHRVTSIWKYNKIKTSEGAIIYDSVNTVNELSLGEAQMVEYAYDVADALGVKYGPIHGEYMIDEKGPILIEVNCRPSGGSMPAPYLERISGQHETDSILDSYLKPEHFFEEYAKRYRLYAQGIVKYFIAPRDLLARSSAMATISENLKSYYSTSFKNLDVLFFKEDRVFRKTKDLHSAAGYVFLAHEDELTIKKELEFLRTVEKHAFSLVLSEDFYESQLKDDKIYVEEIRPLIEVASKYGTGLLVTDQFIEECPMLQTAYGKIDNIRGNFDFILINLNKNFIYLRGSEQVKIILDIFSRVKAGGIIMIPKNTYDLLIGGRKGMEALLKVLDYRIELPSSGVKEIIFASKKR